MKSCPVCSDTYSERIDFCFNDGAALELLPSALDAPVPRRMTARDGATADRLRTGTTQEIRFEAPEAVERPRVPIPVPAAEAPDVVGKPPVDAPPPEPEDDDDDETQTDMQAVRPAAAPSPAPAPAVDAPAAPVFDVLPKDVAARPEPRSAPALMWFLGAAAVAAALVVFVWVVGRRSGEVVVPDAPPPVAAAPVEAPPSEPAPAPAPEAVPAPAPAPVAPARAAAPAPSAPAATASASKPKPTTNVRRTDVALAPPTGPSPWDAPVAVSEGTATITSDPPGAVVRVDGRLRGKTPLDVRLPFGHHEVELSLDGYAVATRGFDLRTAAVRLPNQLEVAAREGTVEVVVPEDWTGATLLVDGRPRGKVPTQIKIAEGAHRFEVRRGDFKAVDQRIVRFDGSGRLRLVLDPR